MRWIQCIRGSKIKVKILILEKLIDLIRKKQQFCIKKAKRSKTKLRDISNGKKQAQKGKMIHFQLKKSQKATWKRWQWNSNFRTTKVSASGHERKHIPDKRRAKAQWWESGLSWGLAYRYSCQRFVKVKRHSERCLQGN